MCRTTTCSLLADVVTHRAEEARFQSTTSAILFVHERDRRRRQHLPPKLAKKRRLLLHHSSTVATATTTTPPPRTTHNMCGMYLRHVHISHVGGVGCGSSLLVRCAVVRRETRHGEGLRRRDARRHNSFFHFDCCNNHN